jgi:hypothetical protein
VPPPPPVDWTPQINEVREIARLWTTQPSTKSRNGRDPEREALIGRLNELVWPIVGAGIGGHSPEGRAIRQTLEVIVSDATRYTSRQHDVAMLALRHNSHEANSIRVRMQLREALKEIERALEYRIPECPGPFEDVREEYDATRNRLLLLRNFISLKL